MNKKKKLIKENHELETDLRYSGIDIYMPLIICGGFFLVTILLFIFGPYNWNVSNTFQLYSFLFSAFIALCAGYIISAEFKRKKIIKKYNIEKIMIISFLVYIVIYVLTTLATTGKVYPDIIRGLFDSGLAYRISHSTASLFTRIVTYLSIITAPITAFLSPLLFIYFKGLSKKCKILAIISLILNLFLGIAQGVINSYATFVFQISMFLILYIFSTLYNKKIKEKIFLFLTIFLLFFSFMGYYKIVMGNRLMADAQSEEKVNNNTTVNPSKNDNKNNKNNKKDNKVKPEYNIELQNDTFNNSAAFSSATLKEKYFLSFLPESVQGSTNHIISYLTHGYKGLSLAMEEDFTSSYGLGFSDFFRHNILKVVGQSDKESKIYSRTYMAKVADKGWKTGEVWSSFFVYPASDIGFTLTIILVFFIGMLFHLSWRDAIESKNIFAAIVFYNMCLMICFFSANNLIFQSGGSFFTMMFMILFWIISRHKKES